MHSRLLLALVAAGLLCASTDCADFHRGPVPVDAGGTDGTQVVDLAFEKLVYPILEMDCVDCHSARGEASNSSYVLTGDAQLDRAVVLALVTPGNPTNSRLLIQATSVSHQGGARFTKDSVEYQTIAAWIQGLRVTAP
jgi:hypothetical protein